jgi:ribonuclease D
MATRQDSASGGEVVRELAALAHASGRLGLDTEFMGEGRYRALLCLVQVAVDDPAAPEGVRIELLDPLRDLDPGPLAGVLADPEIEIVLHSGRQDVAILKRTWRTELHNVFDTQVAAGFAGFPAQAGYGSLLASVLDIHLPKTASYTRWDARPLTPEQDAYARSDVAHLLALADVLHERLEAGGRLEWAREECRALEQASDERDPEQVFRRLPRISQLRPRARAVARELGAWRERTAAAEDRPVPSVMSDVALLEVARRQPTELKALEELRGIQPSTIRRRGNEIVAAVGRGREADPIPADDEERVSTNPLDGPLIALAEAVVRSRALEAGLAYELVAARRDLGSIIGAARNGGREPDVRTLRGWRRDLVGAELLELLAGRRSVDVQDGRRVRITEPPDEP